MMRNCLIATVLALVFLSNVFAAEAPLKPYKVYLKPGTIITKLSDKTDHRIDRGIYVFVMETSPTIRDHFIIYDKDGKAQYETTALGVVEIAKDIAVLPEVDAETIYPAPSIFKANNKKAFFDSQFNLHFDNVDAAPFNSLYGTEFTTAMGTRLEIRTLYNSSLPVNFGLALSMQNVEWSDENGSMKLSSVSIGPHIQHYIFEREKVAVSLLLGAEYSPNFKTTSGEFIDKYHAFMLDFGAEVLWGSDFGKWSVGAHIRRNTLNLISSTRTDITPVPEDLAVNSVGAMLGYKYEWDL